MVSFKAPHCQDEMRTRNGEEFPPDPRDESLYTDVVFPLPETRDDIYYYSAPEAFRHSASSGMENEGRIRWNYRFADDEMFQKTVSNYYRLISGVDREIGLMMEELRKEGLDDNTVILLMGDNGFYLAEHGLAGKWFTHEESVRLPFFIYAPRLPASKRGLVLKDIALNIDVAPTLLSMAGIPIPEQIQGCDLNRVINGNADGWRDSFYYEHTYNKGVYLPCSEAVIGGRYKMTRYFAEKSMWYELYDLETDPYEKDNLSQKQEYAPILETLRATMSKLRTEAGKK